MGKKKSVEWAKLIEQAVKVSGESKVLSDVSKVLSDVSNRCESLNNSADLQECATSIPADNRSIRGWLANSLKKLGKEPKVNNYANFSKVKNITLDHD